MHNVVWFEVIGKDAARLHAFYGELFDWKLDADNPSRYGQLSMEGRTGGIPGGICDAAGIEKTGVPGKPWVTFYVSTPDIPATLGRVEKLGGRVVLAEKALADGTIIALFEDPDGSLIGLVKTRP
jgi:uncharacterized protein